MPIAMIAKCMESQNHLARKMINQACCFLITGRGIALT
jgi:hypothetical protein